MKFIKFSKYALYLVSNTRDKMSRFLTGVSNDLVEGCPEAMLHNNIGIYFLWCMLIKLKKLSIRREIGMPRGQDTMTEVLPR